jgi:hypothetical protein
LTTRVLKAPRFADFVAELFLLAGTFLLLGLKLLKVILWRSNLPSRAQAMKTGPMLCWQLKAKFN